MGFMFGGGGAVVLFGLCQVKGKANPIPIFQPMPREVGWVNRSAQTRQLCERRVFDHEGSWQNQVCLSVDSSSEILKPSYMRCSVSDIQFTCMYDIF